MMKNIGYALLVIAMPFMLFVAAWQSSRYTSVQREISRLEKSQAEIIDSNKHLISGISLLSAPERIERMAQAELAMRKVRKDEILRIALRRGGLGG